MWTHSPLCVSRKVATAHAVAAGKGMKRFVSNDFMLFSYFIYFRVDKIIEIF
ncbi:hypothetical protein DFP98_11549 [Cohnella phaseoli]|uniref:Uncharacterized protein n=1 Tax=Cohnella phaseoli TaxID=456490 RepID=A0A3D9JN64_9BACL|nr:hypothetical protein DFP98_11549 [Cohnella phaseoli]